MVSKTIDAPYTPGNRGLWRKAKALNRQEFVIVGWSDPEGSRAHLGALLLGYFTDEGKLIYAGRVGTGMPVKVPGVGALAASAILASAPDPQTFKSGRDFAAWLGATPKQNSTGGKEKFGSITKQGNRYIRRLLVLGAISVLRAAPKRKGALCDWLAALRARKPAKVVAVALANKLARIVWAIITTGEAFRSSIYAKA